MGPAQHTSVLPSPTMQDGISDFQTPELAKSVGFQASKMQELVPLSDPYNWLNKPGFKLH